MVLDPGSPSGQGGMSPSQQQCSQATSSSLELLLGWRKEEMDWRVGKAAVECFSWFRRAAALEGSYNYKERSELIYEIQFLIHGLILNGIKVNFFWIPSHSGLLFNDWADKAAKMGAQNQNAFHINYQHSFEKNVFFLNDIYV